MLFRLLFLFITVPLVELVLLLMLADRTSWWLTLALVVVTGFIGTLLTRAQGFRTYRRIQQELASGQMPKESVVDALMIFVAGALLLTPGMLTDAFGLSLLFAPCRRFYRARLVRWFKSNFQFEAYSTGRDGTGSAQPGPGSAPGQTRIIDSYVVDSSKDNPAS